MGLNEKKTKNALILQYIDTRHSSPSFGTLKCHNQGLNHDPAEKIGVQCCRNQRWMEAAYRSRRRDGPDHHSFNPSLISTTLGTYLSRIMIDSLMMAF
jgi:hypothetical protein